MEMEDCLILNVRIIPHQKQFSHVVQTTHIWFISKCHSSTSPFPHVPVLPAPSSLHPLSTRLYLVTVVPIKFFTSLLKFHLSCHLYLLMIKKPCLMTPHLCRSWKWQSSQIRWQQLLLVLKMSFICSQNWKEKLCEVSSKYVLCIILECFVTSPPWNWILYCTHTRTILFPS